MANPSFRVRDAMIMFLAEGYHMAVKVLAEFHIVILG